MIIIWTCWNVNQKTRQVFVHPSFTTVSVTCAPYPAQQNCTITTGWMVFWRIPFWRRVTQCPIISFVVPINCIMVLYGSVLTPTLRCLNVPVPLFLLVRLRFIPGFTQKAFHSSLRWNSLPLLLLPSHDAVSLSFSCVSCAGRRWWPCDKSWSKAGQTCALVFHCALAAKVFTVALALHCLDHVALGLDLLHQRGPGEACHRTCTQVSCVNEICLWSGDEEVKGVRWYFLDSGSIANITIQ